MRVILALLFGGAVATLATAAHAQEIDWQKVDAAFGRKPAVSGDVHRYGFPRTDLQVSVDGVAIKPAFALGGWIAMKPVQGGAMAMGDLVLAGNRDQSGDEQVDRRWPRHHRGPQSSSPRQPGNLLHARRRARRPGQNR